MTKRRIVELDGIRGLACLLILILHIFVVAIKFSPGSSAEFFRLKIQLLFHGGVDLFFVLSGFLIGGILMDNRKAENYFAAFWTRRIARIFPVYFLMIAIYLVISHIETENIAINALANSGGVIPIYAYATFTQNFWMAITQNGGSTILGVTWSLAIEEQFYFCFPFLAFWIPHEKMLKLATIFLPIVILIRTSVWFFTKSFFSAYVLTFGRVDALLMGVIVACIIRSPKSLAYARRYRVTLTCIALGLLTLVGTDSFTRLSTMVLNHQQVFLGMGISILQFPAFSGAFAMLLLGVFTHDKKWWFSTAMRSSILTRLGLISYAAYMYHQTVNNGIFYGLLNKSPQITDMTTFSAAIAVLVISIILATISYFAMEMPIRNLASKVHFKYRSVPPNALLDSNVKSFKIDN